MDRFTLDFVGIGPQRTASSWLHQVLLHHPKVAFPAGVKETMFFDQRYAKGLGWYAAHFAHAATDQLRAEIAPTYFDDDAARERLRGLYPDLKIIINVRNPVERAFSLFRHHVAKGRVAPDFERAIETMPRIITSGRYAAHCPLWEQAFGASNVLYIVQEDASARPEEVLERVCRFLDLPVIPLPAVGREVFGAGTVPRFRVLALAASSAATALRSLRLHRIAEWGKRIGLTRVYRGGRREQSMSAATRARLQRVFEPDIDWLERRLDRDFSAWRSQGRGGDAGREAADRQA